METLFSWKRGFKWKHFILFYIILFYFQNIFSRYIAKSKYTRQIFKLDFLTNEALYEPILFHIFHLFFHVESLCTELYRQLQDTLYIHTIVWYLNNSIVSHEFYFLTFYCKQNEISGTFYHLTRNPSITYIILEQA